MYRRAPEQPPIACGCEVVHEAETIPWRTYDANKFFSWPLVMRVVEYALDTQTAWARHHDEEAKENGRITQMGKLCQGGSYHRLL